MEKTFEPTKLRLCLREFRGKSFFGLRKSSKFLNTSRFKLETNNSLSIYMKSAASSLGKLGQMCMSFQFSTPLYERICCDLRNRRAFLLDTSTQPSGDDEFMNRLPFGYLMTASKFDTLFTFERFYKLLHKFCGFFLFAGT
jgi:hypothetical protein